MGPLARSDPGTGRPGSNEHILDGMDSSAEIRRRLRHPVIDIDGHMVEHLPTLAPYVEQEGLSLDHPRLRRLLPPYGGTDSRGTTRRPRNAPSPGRHGARGGARRPARRSIWPRLCSRSCSTSGWTNWASTSASSTRASGSSSSIRRDEQYRRGMCRALNRANAETFAPLSDRLTPVAAIPMHTPDEAIAELDHAVTELGFKAVVCAGYVQRPFDGLAEKDPEVSGYAFWLDQFGVDSAFDYDPVWARAQELGVSVAFHSGFIGMTPYRSISSYVFNHISMLADGQQSLAKSLFLGGVTRRFPGMNFGFLEGGVAWARRCTATSSATGKSATSPPCAATSTRPSSTASYGPDDAPVRA